MKNFLRKHGIYDFGMGFDWRVQHWWRVYCTDFYDWQWHTIRIGPLYISWST